MNPLEVDAGGVKMKNPVALASGTCGYGEVFAEFCDPAQLGAVVVKGISLEPRAGNPAPRMAETACGMLNSIGLENVGLSAFVSEKLPWLRERGVTAVVNIMGATAGEYCRLASQLSSAEGVHGIELNISCPNVEAGGISFGSRPEIAADLVRAVRAETGLPLWVKLSPNLADIGEMARAVEDAGADAVSLVNTFRGMAIDVEEQKPVLASVSGGVSGPAIKPMALYLVYEAARAVEVPVIGIGGIMGPKDAIEFMLAGASAVQVGTANFIDPGIPLKIVQGIEAYLARHGMASVRDLTGALKEPART